MSKENTNNENLNAALEAQKIEIEELTKGKHALYAQIDKVEKQNAELIAQDTYWKSTIEGLQTLNSSLYTQIDKLTEENKKLTEQNGDLNDKIGKLGSLIDDQDALYKDLEKQNSALDIENQKLSSLVDTLSENNNTLKAKIDTQTKQFHSTEQLLQNALLVLHPDKSNVLNSITPDSDAYNSTEVVNLGVDPSESVV